eukprot:CAMPEP_0175418860 /NCGR_PEP_ID=MMETSP0095-20121207/45932_1 /TAXON_ID=311494 /ORGANISM="Alexandrium monilatum, Strain CCMP3105" /LENGTH=45 /DNA_ID= /DNA_START= /DNA_END= /DNA_ORIENTATION=
MILSSSDAALKVSCMNTPFSTPTTAKPIVSLCSTVTNMNHWVTLS